MKAYVDVPVETGYQEGGMVGYGQRTLFLNIQGLNQFLSPSPVLFSQLPMGS